MVTKKVLLAISGGVDSCCAAILLLHRGFYVEGVTFSLPKFKNNNKRDLDDAMSVCCKLGIKHRILDLSDHFKNRVVDPFCDTYLNGQTPNPCVTCNKQIKFGILYRFMDENGFDYLATGHYARIVNKKLLEAKCITKDQSYFLYGIDRKKLSRLIFPLGDYSKEEIRRIVEEEGISIFKKPESQEICFVDKDYKSFISSERSIVEHSGKFVDSKGLVLGNHRGILNYTVGQRRGLNISMGKRLYVTNINPDSNTITLGELDNLYKKNLVADNLNLLAPKNDILDIIKNNKIYVKIRSVQKKTPAHLSFLDDKALVNFENPQKAITCGQSAVFYHNENVLGGGIICKAF